MTISSVEITEYGYLVNGNQSVPNAAKNLEFKAVQAWIAAGGVPRPLKPHHLAEWTESGWSIPVAVLKADLAAKRYDVETGGFLFDGVEIHSDSASQFKIVAEVLRVNAGDRVDGDLWKGKDGNFHALTNSEFLQMYSVGSSHVQKCFAVEAACIARIESGETDIETMWADEWIK